MTKMSASDRSLGDQGGKALWQQIRDSLYLCLRAFFSNVHRGLHAIYSCSSFTFSHGDRVNANLAGAQLNLRACMQTGDLDGLMLHGRLCTQWPQAVARESALHCAAGKLSSWQRVCRNL